MFRRGGGSEVTTAATSTANWVSVSPAKGQELSKGTGRDSHAPPAPPSPPFPSIIQFTLNAPLLTPVWEEGGVFGSQQGSP